MVTLQEGVTTFGYRNSVFRTTSTPCSETITEGRRTKSDARTVQEGGYRAFDVSSEDSSASVG